MLGACIAIIRDNKILLTKREDFEVWCLPGGHTDPGESIAQTAIREAREETGLEVSLCQLVGLYSRPGWQNGYNVALFTAEVVGGEMQPQVEEVIDIGWFDPDELPPDIIVGHRQRILDAFAGIGGSAVYSEQIAWPFDDSVDRQRLYALRDESGLGRREFYERHFTEGDSIADIEGRPLTS